MQRALAFWDKGQATMDEREEPAVVTCGVHQALLEKSRHLRYRPHVEL